MARTPGGAVKIFMFQLQFDDDDATYLKQLATMALSTHSKFVQKKGAKKSLGYEADIFFYYLPNMTFNLVTRRFEVDGPAHWYRNRFITKKATAGANKKLAELEVVAAAKAKDLKQKAGKHVEQKFQNAGVQLFEEFIKEQSGLTSEQMKTVKEVFLPIFFDVVSSSIVA
jgi:hypothetical protein